ncbi:hypothetical protein EXN66_Car005448 [Channa argus]|uniref:Neuromedin-K n=2 Tax=Channa argus TaxID=215402 RepID=A0A6G1PID3_CHAAH|nr:hypothetical protein EXN66_Car005448 [Channa argus]
MMDKSPNTCTLASLVAMVILILFPVTCWCEEDVYKSLMEVKKECCVGAQAELKRFGDIDYDSFVSLMGRRSVGQPKNHKNIPMSGKGRVKDILADLLGWWRSDKL